MSASGVVAVGGPAEYRATPPGLACSGHHPDAGRLDESARRLSHDELAVAEGYLGEGHTVRSRPERRGGGRAADLEVCGVDVEVKSFLPAAERGGGAPSAYSVYNKLVDASGQAGHAVLYGIGSGLTRQAAVKGLDRYRSAPTNQPKLDHIRIVGDGFELSVSRQPERAVQLGGKTPQRGLDLGL